MQIVKKTTLLISLFLSFGLLPNFVTAQEQEEFEYIDDQLTLDEANAEATTDANTDVSSSDSNEIVFEEIQQPKKGELIKSDYTTPLASGEILVETMRDLTKPYKERRSQYGLVFSVNNEKFNPVDYFSIAQGRYYDDFSDQEAINVMGFEIGGKYNFSLGSFSALVGYGSGSYSNDEQNINGININITKADINFALDNITSEPWIVPYAQFGIHQMDWTEESTVGASIQSESFYSNPNYHYKVGAMFQLNWIEAWIDPDSPTQALRSSGLENAFLDVFYTYYAQPETVSESENEEGEGDLSSGDIGFGMKLEF